MLALTLATTEAWYSCVPCEKFSLTMFIPAFLSSFIDSTLLVRGPIVQMMAVLRRDCGTWSISSSAIHFNLLFLAVMLLLVSEYDLGREFFWSPTATKGNGMGNNSILGYSPIKGIAFYFEVIDLLSFSK